MLPYNNRLVKRRDFETVYKFGRRSFAGNIGLKFMENKLKETRIGIAVGIKFSKKAVVRNTAKRKIGEILRKKLEKLKKGYDMVVFIKTEKPGQKKIESQKVEKDLMETLQKARLLED